jgi:hypothetical protein
VGREDTPQVVAVNGNARHAQAERPFPPGMPWGGSPRSRHPARSRPHPCVPSARCYARAAHRESLAAGWKSRHITERTSCEKILSRSPSWR